jgi:hypothetical protein
LSIASSKPGDREPRIDRKTRILCSSDENPRLSVSVSEILKSKDCQFCVPLVSGAAKSRFVYFNMSLPNTKIRVFLSIRGS